MEIKNLTKQDVGRWVENTTPYRTKQKGRIKTWNNKYIFVVYNCANDWKNFQNYTAAATDPNELEENNDNKSSG